MYTPKQTAVMLGIATSTVRKYASLYSDHLSDKAGRMQRSYTDQDIATLKRIVDLRRDGYSLSDIPDMLATVLAPPEPEESLKLLPGILTQFEAIYDVQSDHTDQIGYLKDRIDDEDLRKRLEALEELEREREERHNRPWWRKLLG